MLFNKKDHIGQYIVTFQHEKSPCAETYRVKDANGKTRFLKLINLAKLNRQQINDDGLVIETEIAKRLNHHNLCSFVDSGNIIVNGGQRAYIVTEFVSGETIAKKIARDGDLDVYSTKKIAKSVLSALDFLHHQNPAIVHGAVTIQNVMLNLLGGFDDLKLIGFGHASFLNQPLAKPNLEELNPLYLAPERFSGVCQVQSDLYSVGVMLYQLIYGILPWSIDISRVNNDTVERILSKKSSPLKIPTTDIFELDEQLINCIHKSLSYEVEDRFQSAQEFIQAIDGTIKLDQQNLKVTQVTNSNKTEKAWQGSKQGSKSLYTTTTEGMSGFSAIAGLDDLKQQLTEEVINPLHNPEEYKRYGVTIPNGMLLYGPLGCGKTFFAKCFAKEVGFNFMHITPASLKSRWINATQENIASMFREAEANAPTIIFIDELDDLFKDRSLAGDDKGMSGINEFLAQMNMTGEKGIFIIGATNRPNLLDPAVLRSGRLEKKYYIGAPDKVTRKALFKLYITSRPYDFGIDYDKLAESTHNYVTADIQVIVNNAARAALKAHSKITMELLLQAINKTKPSLTDRELEEYEQMML